MAKPLQISAVVCPEGSERSGEVIIFLVIFSREIFHSISKNLIFSVSIFSRGVGGELKKSKHLIFVDLKIPYNFLQWL